MPHVNRLTQNDKQASRKWGIPDSPCQDKQPHLVGGDSHYAVSILSDPGLIFEVSGIVAPS